ncbi:MAG: alpha/beta hydrolase [Rhodospirillaceae bacterium]|nr:alpha/beta hydrolase [Rhodospirillaceae bacterium]
MAAFQRSLTYYPDRTRPTPADSGVPELAPVALDTADGLSLLAWYAPPREADAPSLIYFHGNAGHIGMRGFKVRAYLNAGLGVLLTTWRGYSGNPGTPTEDGLYADGRAARAFLRARGCSDDHQVLYGESLGTGVAVHLAREATPAALVLEAPFSSVVDIASGRFPLLPVGPLIVDRFDSAAKIGKVAEPVLIVHGERDRTIPVRLARKLHKRAREPKEAVFIPDADHADLPEFGLPTYVLEFLARHGVSPPAAGAPTSS